MSGEGIATLMLRRPEHHNRLQREDLLTLEAHLERMASDICVRVLMLRAQGPSFCAGFDLRALASGDSLQDPQQLERVINALEALPQPTIALLQGDVHGGGIDLALACDFRIGLQGISAFMPAAKLGVHYYAHGMRRYVQRMGHNAARRLLLSGETFDTEMLLRCGFLDAAYSQEDMHFAPHVLSERLANTPVHILQNMKRDIRALEQGRFDEARINASWQQSLRDIAKDHQGDKTS